MIDGEVDILICFNYASLHPVKEQSVDNLLLMKNRFGRCLGGSCSLTKVNTSVIHHIIMHTVIRDDFFNIEEMGVKCTPVCRVFATGGGAGAGSPLEAEKSPPP